MSLAKAHTLSSSYRTRPFEQTRVRDEFWKRGRARRTLLTHLSSLLMIVRPRDAAQFRHRATLHRSHRLFPESVASSLWEMSIHLIELIDIEIGQTLPLTGLIGSPCFFRGFFIRYIIYQLSTRRLWPALSLLWGSFTSSPGRPTIIYRSTWWCLDGEVSIYHYREAKPSLSCLQSLFSSCLLYRRARKHSCQCLSIDLAPLSMLSRKKLLSTVCGIILWKSTSCLSAVTVSVERVKQKLLQTLVK